MTRSRALSLLLVVALTLVAWPHIHKRVRSARMLADMSSGQPPATDRVVTRDWSIPLGPNDDMPARIYFRSNDGRGKGVVLVHGVHRDGIDERRLVAFANRLANAGLVVMTPEIRDVADYRITPGGIDAIEAAVHALSRRSDLIEDERVGLVGFSFAGGLGLVAATRPSLQPHLSYVASVGGHHQLERVLRFFVSDEIDSPTGRVHMKAHDYGLVVLVYGHVEHFVPRQDVDTMRVALRAWLREDRPRARREADRCRTEACRTLFEHVQTDTLEAVRPQVLKMIEGNRESLEALSPAGKLHLVPAPVLLLHGSADSVIPPTELSWAQRELEGQEHHALITPLLDHVEVSKTATFSDELALVDFMARLF